MGPLVSPEACLPCQIFGNAARVLASQTCRAVAHAFRILRVHIHAYSGHQSLHTQVGQTVRTHMLCQLVCVHLVGDQFLSRGYVDAHVARVLQWRTGDTDVHLSGTGISQQLNNGPDRVAPDNGVVDQDQTFPSNVLRQRSELLGHSQLPKTIRGLDEGATHVTILAEHFCEVETGLEMGKKG